MIKSRLAFEIYDEAEAVETVQSIIPLAKAGVCVNCDRVFTILPGQSVCPGCGSVAWGRVKPWLDNGRVARTSCKEVA